MTAGLDSATYDVYDEWHDINDFGWLKQAGYEASRHRPVRPVGTSALHCTGCELVFTGEEVFYQHVADRVTAAAFEDMEQYVFDVNEANGWHEDERHPLTGHMLIVSEVAEATDAYRDWDDADMTGKAQIDKALPGPGGLLVPKPLGAGSEYGDVLVRLLDSTKRERTPSGIKSVYFEFKRKVSFNRLRGYKHGGRLV